MPTTFRLIIALLCLGLAGYGIVYYLATQIEPKPRQITVTIPSDRFLP